jgi:acetylornithine/N-succinyldiaminopimelate aminotransferase
MTTSADLSTFDLVDSTVMPTYGRMKIALERGAGSYVWDEHGKRYLDFGAGIAVSSLGHGHPKVQHAIQDQASRLIHSSNLYYTRPQGLLAEKLLECVGQPGRIFFSNSGAEANEGLYKLARRYGNETAPGGRFEIITFEGSFHGRTMAGISATAQEKVKVGFAPLLSGFKHVPFNDLEAVESAIGPQTVAILVEPIQGEGGIRPARAEFLKKLREICDRHDLLLLFDEIQCGLGRTGSWCGWQSIAGPDLVPDAVSWAKGIAGGFPLGAFWARTRPVKLRDGKETTLDVLLGPGSHATTYGGGPLATAVGHAVLSVIEEEQLLQNATRLGERLQDRLRQIASPLVQEVRGVGLLVGIVLVPDFLQKTGLPGAAASLALVQRLNESGILTVPAGLDVVRLLPPLNVSEQEIDEAVTILNATLASLI